MKMLLQLQHVKLLKLGCWFIKYLSALEVENQFALALQCNCLTLDGANFNNFLSGFMFVIRSSRNLENFVMKFPHYKVVRKGNQVYAQHPTVDMNECRKNCWNSSVVVFDCPVSNLKMVKIVFRLEQEVIYKLVFNFIEFLVRNSQVIERIVVILPNGRVLFEVEVCRRLLGFQRCHPHINVELCHTSR